MKTCVYKSLSILMLIAFSFCQNPYALVLAQGEVSNVSMQDNNQEADMQAKKNEVINLVIGDIQSVAAKKLNRVSVTSPDVVDISDAKADKLLVVGKKAGETELFVWDENGKRSITVRVAGQNLDALKVRVEEVISKAQIKGIAVDKNEHEGKLIVSGTASKKDKENLEKITEPFSEGIINLVKQELSEDLVEIDAQFIELNSTLDKTLGMDWFTGTQTRDATTGQVTTTSSGTFQLDYLEVLPGADGKPADFFKIGNFYRGKESALVSKISALVSDNKARIISRPRLVVLSGKEASFLVGGEVPITSTTTTGGGSGTTTSSVTYKQYGVNMTITPTVRDGKIDIILNMQISDIDRSTADRNGDVGFTSRLAQTQLYLDDKQTIVLAGLIRHNESNNVRKVAFLGDIPVLGAFFRSRGTPSNDTELVIILTPRILKSKKLVAEQLAMPTKGIVDYRNEFEGKYEKQSFTESQPKAAIKGVFKPQPPVVKQPVLPARPVNKDSGAVILPYVRDIQLRISQAITYPYEAVQNKWEGTVKLRLRILSDGTLADCDLLESSGHDVFDRDAQNTARIVAPFLAFPQDVHQKDVVVTVPIVYNLRTTVKNNAQTVVASY